MGDRLVSVITPVYGDGVAHLRAAYDSLAAQAMPAGWAWEWLVQEDGRTGARLPEDPRVRPGQGRHGGPATARNLALARARGDLVKVLDVDDQLTAGALARDIAVLDRQPGIGWTTCAALDLWPDGTTRASGDDPAPGILRGDRVAARWRDRDHLPPVHPATLCVRRDLVVMLGGWMALPASEDTGLLLAAAAISDGWFIAVPGLLYRKWPGQATGRPAHTDPTERDARTALIDARVRALAASGRWPPATIATPTPTTTPAPTAASSTPAPIAATLHPPAR